MQILMNLVTNGIKYNSSKMRKIRIRIQEELGQYHFEVQDNGDGINEREKEKVFELFENAGNSDRNGDLGTGIGLSVVKKLIDKMGGEINYSSIVNEGTTFRFNLPME